jgi:DNA (cytosine-5)-methyltransferase 1
MHRTTRTYYEFFAGGGMARLGLGQDWRCLMANDISAKKAETYLANFGGEDFKLKDINELTTADMPGRPDLAWASFPCQDLSLAGNRGGLSGERSGTFWGFWSAINKLRAEHRAPPILVLENVCGTLTSNDGRDFAEICAALASARYNFGAVVVDAVHFVPQSRPRLFIVCVDEQRQLPVEVFANGPVGDWHTPAVKSAVAGLRPHLAAKWRWWKLPPADLTGIKLESLIDDAGANELWHSPAETDRLLKMMSPTNVQKVRDAQGAGRCVVGTIYRRTRVENGARKQRAEVRFDGIAGCLRTPGGGSSRQTLIVVEGPMIRSRLLSVREAARLMGVPDSYRIPANYNDGYHVFGDGLVVPAVAFIREHLLEPIASSLAVDACIPAMAAE